MSQLCFRQLQTPWLDRKCRFHSVGYSRVANLCGVVQHAQQNECLEVALVHCVKGYMLADFRADIGLFNFMRTKREASVHHACRP